MFNVLAQQNIGSKYIFRADSASHQFEVFKTLEQNDCTFYIGAKNSYVEKLFSKVKQWDKVADQQSEMWIGQTTYTPFLKRYSSGEKPQTYRLLVKRTLNKTGQINILTGDAYEYRAIITNDTEKDLNLAIKFYNQRGAAEKQFDILKNDFGWSSLPFSHLAENCVFLYFTAMCRNIYNTIIYTFAKRYNNIKNTDRMKRFVFTFITIPAEWVKRSRTWFLRIFGKIHLRI